MKQGFSNKLLGLLERALKIDPNEFAALKLSLRSRDPFKMLIMTILTQNTSDRNAIEAYNRLSSKFNIEPQVLASAPLSEIENAIRIAGLYRRRAQVIKAVSKAILERFNGDIRAVFNCSLDEARNALMSLPGVGRKTADVLLLFIAGKPTFPVDTHITRVCKRLGLVPLNANYEVIRRTLMEIFPPEKYLDAHLLLIAFGRKYCRARSPLCNVCPLKGYCNFAKFSMH